MADNERIGYSPKINDPAFARYIKNSNSYSAYFSATLALIAVIGFFIAGETSDQLKNPDVLEKYDKSGDISFSATPVPA